MKVRFWGVRGSLPCPGPSTLKMGGNTTCLEIRADGNLIILDAGSGVRPLGGALLKEGKPVKAHLFFTHVHHDHTMGWPFFVPAFIPTTQLKIFGERKDKLGIKDVLSAIMTAPFFPVPLEVMKAQMEFNDIKEGQVIKVSPNVTVTAHRLNHPNECLGYRVESVEKGKKRIFSFVSDTEHFAEVDPKALELARNADAMVYDSAYTAQEYETKKGWGHSTWEEGIKLAKAAKAKRLLLFHHDPSHDDKFMAKLLVEARKKHKGTHLAFEGLELSF